MNHEIYGRLFNEPTVALTPGVSLDNIYNYALKPGIDKTRENWAQAQQAQPQAQGILNALARNISRLPTAPRKPTEYEAMKAKWAKEDGAPIKRTIGLGVLGAGLGGALGKMRLGGRWKALAALGGLAGSGASAYPYIKDRIQSRNAGRFIADVGDSAQSLTSGVGDVMGSIGSYLTKK